jgi:pyruvate/2-oxoglutarate dehydrogenase complex dihydrolipoamide dehydrogenase (E3) component
MLKYDAIIVGSGQAANPLAHKLAEAGWKTALIERKFVGGTCINVGCTPTKTLVASGRVSYLVKRSADYGVIVEKYSIDIESVIRRKNAHVLEARESSARQLLETPNLDVVFGNAVFSGPKEITVTKGEGDIAVMTADKIFINTGTRPVVPPIQGLAGIHYLTSDTILDLLVVPSHLAIIGGSYIALEFGQLYRRLGSEVTIIEGNEQFLAKEDEDIAAAIRKILEEDGIRILTGTTVSSVAAAGGAGARGKTAGGNGATVKEMEPPAAASSGKGVELTVVTGGAPSAITASHVLVAAGRLPDTAALNVAATGVTVDKHGFIVVNDRLETSVQGVYALGDVKGGPQFTHISYNDHLIVYRNLVEHANLSIAGRELIYCLFTDPELGRVGLTEKMAREKGLNIKVVTLPASRIARAWENDETRGMLKAVVSLDDGKILGAAALCVGGGELMSILQMAMMGGVTYDRIRDAVYAHPTFAESLNVLFAGVDQ